MSVHLTEEEQIEIFKRWWKENGKTVVIAIVVAIVAYFAFTAWKEKQQQKAEGASAQYEALLKLVAVEQGKTISDADRTTAEHIAGELKKNFGGSMYAHSASFFLAKLAVEKGNLDAAVTELQAILAAKPDVATAQLAHIRLSKVLLSKAAYDEALAQLKDEPSKAFASEYAEARGDILLAQGNKDAALTAYEKAQAGLDPQQQERQMILQMKVDHLKTAPKNTEEKAQ